VPYEDDDDSDDDIGPRPPGEDEAGPEKSAVEEFLEREKRRAEQLEEKEKPKVLKREEWMLVPPEAGVMSTSELQLFIVSRRGRLTSPKLTLCENAHQLSIGPTRRSKWTIPFGQKLQLKSISVWQMRQLVSSATRRLSRASETRPSRARVNDSGKKRFEQKSSDITYVPRLFPCCC
jgi:hypothetical protein